VILVKERVYSLSFTIQYICPFSKISNRKHFLSSIRLILNLTDLLSEVSIDGNAVVYFDYSYYFPYSFINRRLISTIVFGIVIELKVNCLFINI
jgi:hypothetical protein